MASVGRPLANLQQDVAGRPENCVSFTMSCKKCAEPDLLPHEHADTEINVGEQKYRNRFKTFIYPDKF